MAPPDLGSRCEGGPLPGEGEVRPLGVPVRPRARGAGGAASGVHGKSGFRPPLVAPCLRGRPALQPAALLPRGESPGGPVSASARGAARGATRGVTPRQACPRPGGLGRNLRSKTRWFAGFCNSHQVSHFATFFIDARAEISVAESRFGMYDRFLGLGRSGRVPRGRGRGAPRGVRCSLAPGGAGGCFARGRGRGRLGRR